MQLCYVPVTTANRRQAESLRVKADQDGFIESVADCMAEADLTSDWKPVAVFDKDTMVGFAMYGRFREGGERRVWLDRLLIDGRFQGRGYGKAAVAGLLDRLQSEYGAQPVYLSVYADNRAAVALYESLGFTFNGEVDTKGELVMVRPPRAV